MLGSYGTPYREKKARGKAVATISDIACARKERRARSGLPQLSSTTTTQRRRASDRQQQQQQQALPLPTTATTLTPQHYHHHTTTTTTTSPSLQPQVDSASPLLPLEGLAAKVSLHRSHWSIGRSRYSTTEPGHLEFLLSANSLSLFL